MTGATDEARLIDWLRERFPFIEPARVQDRAAVRRQLGREPQGEYVVSRRCPHGLPAVVLTLPFEGEGRPVPPLLWLCCPWASNRIGALESSGTGERVREWLAGDAAASEDFQSDERDFSEAQSEIARVVAGERVSGRLEGRGIAGSAHGAVKCLHAHLACRLSLTDRRPAPGAWVADRPGVVGAWCECELEKEGGTWCEKPPAACVP